MGINACGSAPETPPPSAEARTIRQLPEGELIGFIAPSGAQVWRGLPYRRSAHRGSALARPRAPGAWEGRREALAFGSACPQIASPLGGAPDNVMGQIWGDEDCLFLNVYAPGRPGQRRPPGHGMDPRRGQ